uniref:Large ribosomal subunit protein uL24 n=1 Tax=candidate division WOR-3 bacterium TaxID=2052148 RepID=A0A7V3KNF2_UNCW3
MKIKRDDLVLVIAGKDKGKIGKVKKVIREKSRVVVEGVNIVKKHMRARGPQLPSGIIQMEAPIHVSNVKLVCPMCGQATRVGFVIKEDGKKSRVCKKCGKEID